MSLHQLQLLLHFTPLQLSKGKISLNSRLNPHELARTLAQQILEHFCEILARFLALSVLLV